MRNPRRLASKEFREARNKHIWYLFHEEHLTKVDIGERKGMSPNSIAMILRDMRAEKMVEFVREND